MCYRAIKSLVYAAAWIAAVLPATCTIAASPSSAYWTAKVTYRCVDTRDLSVNQPGITGSGRSVLTHTLSLLILFAMTTDASGNLHSVRMVSIRGGGISVDSEHRSGQLENVATGESSTYLSGGLDIGSCRAGLAIYPSKRHLDLPLGTLIYHVHGSIQHSAQYDFPMPGSSQTKTDDEEDDFPDGQNELDLSGSFQAGNKPGTYTIKFSTLTHTPDGKETQTETGSVVVTPGREGVQITQVTLPDQNNTGADATGNLPFCSNSTKTDNDTIHWIVDAMTAPSDVLHWSVSPDVGSVTPSSGTGDPPDFQLLLVPASDRYLTTARPTIHITLKAWLLDSEGNTAGAPASYTVAQSDLGRLRQEYADHPMKPVNAAMKKVPDVSSFVNTTTDQPDLAKFNRGDYAWAMVDPWMTQEYSSAGELPFNSAYRNPVRNWYIYVVENHNPNVNASSQHMWGNAIDFSTSNTLLSYVSVAQQVVNPTANGVWENRFDHVHVQHYISSRPKVAALLLLQNQISGGGSLSGVVILDHSIGAGATDVTLQCPNPSVVQLPANVTIPAGQLCGTVSINTSAGLTAKTTIPITAATMDGYATASLTVLP